MVGHLQRGGHRSQATLSADPSQAIGELKVDSVDEDVVYSSASRMTSAGVEWIAAYARPMQFTIRPVAVGDEDDGDLEAVLQLWREAAQPTSTDTDSALRALVEHDQGALMVAEESGRIVGSIIAAWDGWRGSVYRLVVAPDFRRSGLGRQLVDEAERRLTELGAQRTQAIVVGSDSRAMGFWSATEWELQENQVRFAKG